MMVIIYIKKRKKNSIVAIKSLLSWNYYLKFIMKNTGEIYKCYKHRRHSTKGNCSSAIRNSLPFISLEKPTLLSSLICTVFLKIACEINSLRTYVQNVCVPSTWTESRLHFRVLILSFTPSWSVIITQHKPS